MSAQLVLEQAVQQMATDCAVDVANHELFPPAAKVLQSMTAHWGGLTVFVACPWAANWINVGRTAGRGKKSTSHKRLIPAKDI